MTENPHRLQRALIPVHYNLHLEPDLEDHSFRGQVVIDVDASEPFDAVTLHAVDLQISDARLTQGQRSVGVVEVTPNEDYQRLTFDFGETFERGAAQLEIAFVGELNDRLQGFYRSVIHDEDGSTHTVATTQFQATDARRAFPCFDEPSMKATYDITVVVPAWALAISNSAEESRRSVDDDHVEVRFARTMKMSSYIVAVVVGPFEATEAVDVDGVPLRVVGRRGTGPLADFALEAGAFCLRYLSDYYAIPYPGDKVDLVAIPDFAAGAMENLGCITFRETALLADTSTATQAELVRVLDVIAHELAHMWFGDLVTMEWWDGIWLNEAFATFMEMKATDAMRPEWKRWSSFASTERPWALEVDALHSSRPVEFAVGSPEEANEMFDALTYGKGSSVLRMIEQFLGEHVFRDGIGSYLLRHAYGNTVTKDLWAALDASSRMDVGSIMDTWILQEGHPQVNANLVEATLKIGQSRYLAIPDDSDHTIWKVPLQIRGFIDGEPYEAKHVVQGPVETLELPGTPDWIIVNAGGHGFYRSSYDAHSFDRLISNIDQLDDLERYVTIDDAWAFVQSGDLTVEDYIGLAGGFRHEPEWAIWQSITGAMGEIRHHVVTDDKLGSFSKVVEDLYGPVMARMGWTPDPNEPALDRRLRGLVISAMGRLARDDETIERSRSIAQGWLDDPESVDPDIGQAALFITAGEGDVSAVDDLLRAKKRAHTPQIEMKILQAISLVDVPGAVDEVIGAMNDGRIRTQDVSWVYASMLGRRKAGAHAWQRLESQWDELTALMPGMTKRRLVEGIPHLSDPSTAEDVVSFFAEVEAPSIATAVAQNLERLEVNRRLRLRERERFDAT